MTANNLAVVVATKNNLRTIGECLESIQGLYDHLLVVDSGSTDGTIELCRSRGAEVIHRPWPGMVAQRQFCLDACKDYRWVLVLDSDESIDGQLFAEIQRVVAEDRADCDGYTFNRKVWFMGGWLHHVFQPEFRLRLVRGGVATMDGVGPEGQGGHDRIEVAGNVGRLAGTCKHDSWENAGHMMARYLELAQRAALYDPKPGSVPQLLLSPFFAFLKQYIWKGGIRDGRRGLIAAAGSAAGNFLKQILKLARSSS